MSIIYDRDWLKYPAAIVHNRTKNKSFLEYVVLLDSMGVNNSRFCLALHNPDLEFVDPHDPNLSAELKLAVAIECSENIWYAVREVIRIPPTSGDDSIPFKANRGNMALLWSYYAGITYAAIQPRQTGKSVGADVITVINMAFLCINTELLLVTANEKLLSRNIRRLKELFKLLPSYLYPKSRNDADNNERITLLARGNILTGLIAQKDRKAANSQGRGMTAAHIQYDEPPFQANISEIIPAATSAGARARSDARDNGSPHGILYTTTPGDINDKEAKFVYDIITSGAVMDERAFFDSLNYDDLYNRVLSNGTSKSPLINGTFNHRQLGFSDEWLYGAIADAKLSRYKADMEFFNQWKAGKQSDLIPVALQDTISANGKEAIYLETTLDKKFIYWYISENELNQAVANKEAFILGLDTSDSIGRDAIAGIIINASTGFTVGRFTVNDENLYHFGSTFLLGIMLKYTNITLIPEMKSSARGIIDSVAMGLIANDINPFKRIYNKVVQSGSDSDSSRDKFTELQRRSYTDINYFNNRRSEFGFITSSSSRSTLYDNILFKATKALAPYITDSILISEISGLSEKNGRVDHDSSGNDDHVIAWLLAQWLRYEGRNLKYYGITNIDTSIVWGKSDETIEDVVDDIRDASIGRSIEDIKYRLENCDDAILSKVLESRLRSLMAQLSKPSGHGSIEEVLRSVANLRESRAHSGAIDYSNIFRAA